jgi:hypothetical protein
MQDGAHAVEGPETGNNITKRVKEHGYEGMHLGGTDAESWVMDMYHVPLLLRLPSLLPFFPGEPLGNRNISKCSE